LKDLRSLERLGIRDTQVTPEGFAEIMRYRQSKAARKNDDVRK